MSTPCNPPLEIESYRLNKKTIHVIRDDYLDAGTKQRGQKFFHLISSRGYSGVVTIAATTGYGQVATSVMAMRARLKAFIIVPYEVPVNPMTERVKRMNDSHYIVVTRGDHKLRYVDPIVNQLVELDDGYPNDPSSNTTVSNSLMELVLHHFGQRHQLYELSLGLDDPDYIRALVDALLEQVGSLQPARLWITVGSGTILTALKTLWPTTEFICVQVGRDISGVMTRLGIPLENRYVSRYKFAQSIGKKERPPFPSLANYDAKAWTFIDKNGKHGDYFWNVAG